MTSKKKLTLCVFIDALGWESIQRHSFLNDILEVKAPLGTIFGYSSTCDPTILTGVLPREHGHFTFFAYNPEKSPFAYYKYFGLLPKSIMERGRVRSKFSRIMKRVHGFTGYFQLYNMPFQYLHLFDYMERKNIFEPGGINGGQPTIFDFLRQNQIAYCRPEGYDEAQSVAEVEQAITGGAIRFSYLFLGRLDGLLHEFGTRAPVIAEHLAWYQSQIRRLYELACRSYDSVRLMVFSDHGMADIQAVCDVMGRIDRLGMAFGKDYAAVFDSTMARFWFLRPGARSAIEAALSEIPQGRLLTDQELAGYGCDFPGKTYGELFFLMNPGVLLCPSHMGIKPLAGMHGYAPDHADSVASFMTNAPLDPLPRRLDDLYAVMRRETSENGA